MGSDARGAAAIDVVVSVALTLILAAVALPAVGGAMERERALIGARYLAGLLQRARFEALRRGTSVALRFDQADQVTRMTLVADGNGDGVLQRDIDRGIDRAISAPDGLDDHARGVTFRVNQTVPDIAGVGALDAGTDPIRIGRSSLVSFGPAGTATPGTLYVSADQGPQLAVRILGATGRVRVLQFDPQHGRWTP